MYSKSMLDSAFPFKFWWAPLPLQLLRGYVTHWLLMFLTTSAALKSRPAQAARHRVQHSAGSDEPGMRSAPACRAGLRHGQAAPKTAARLWDRLHAGVPRRSGGHVRLLQRRGRSRGARLAPPTQLVQPQSPTGTRDRDCSARADTRQVLAVHIVPHRVRGRGGEVRRSPRQAAPVAALACSHCGAAWALTSCARRAAWRC